MHFDVENHRYVRRFLFFPKTLPVRSGLVRRTKWLCCARYLQERVIISGSGGVRVVWLDRFWYP